MQVTIRQFIKDFKQGCNSMVMQRALQLGKGQCVDFLEYKKNVGYIAGLEAGVNLAENMMRQMEESEAEENLPEMGSMS